MSQFFVSATSGGGGSFVGSPTYFQAAVTSPVTISGGDTSQTIVFNNVLANVGSAYNGSTGVFTAPVTGFYGFTSTVYFNSINTLTSNTETILAYTGNVQSLRLIQQGAGADNAGTNIILTVAWAMPMTAGDTVKMQPFADGTGTYQIFGSGFSPSAFSTSSTFSGWRIA